MTDQGALIDVLIAGCLSGLALAVGAAILFSRLARAVRACGVLAVTAYVLNLMANSPARDLLEQPSLSFGLLATFSATAGGLVWVMVVALFDDKPVKPVLFLPAAAVAIATWVVLSASAALQEAAWWTANLLNLLVFLHALYILARGYAGDLIESRRQLRRPLVLACIAMGASQVVFLVSQSLGWGPNPWTRHGPALGELIALLALASVMLELRGALFEAPLVRTQRETKDDEPLVTALDRLMSEDEAWQEEGLSIGLVAQRLKVPEHRLRRLINGRLGYRNFPAFINGYRIEAAKHRLADAAETDRTVAQIAFDLGFTSLSPFNRAFKEATGETPTEWRRRTAADGN